MKVYVSVKQAGKRRAFLTKEEWILKSEPSTLREVITEIISTNVDKYNNRELESSLVNYLTFDEVETQAHTGKVGFGRRVNAQQTDVTKAIDTAMIAFTDGLYRVFVEDKEIESLDEKFQIKEGNLLTFIRFTMLSGRLW
jgi:hypothetical protein